MSDLTENVKVTKLPPGEWKKRIILTCVDGRWTAEQEIKPGEMIVTTRDLMNASRAIRLNQREHARKHRLIDRLANKSTAAGKEVSSG